MSTVARQQGVSATGAELIEFTKEQIAAHKVPEKVFFLPSLPKSAVGKVQRRARCKSTTAVPTPKELQPA